MAFRIVRQLDEMDCASACISMICLHYSILNKQRNGRVEINAGKYGASLLDISEVAERMGFLTSAVKLGFDSLASDAKLPCILHWKQSHFVVLFKIRQNKMYIADPGAGKFKLNASQFKENWVVDHDDLNQEGIALIIEPRELDDVREKTKTYETEKRPLSIFSYLLPYKKLVTQLICGLGLAAIFQLGIPFLAKNVIDAGINQQNTNLIFLLLIAQACLFIGKIAVGYVQNCILLYVSSRVGFNLVNEFLFKLLNLPIAFFEEKKVADILQRMQDHQRIESFLTKSLINIFYSVITLLVFSVVLAIFSKLIFIVFIFSTLLYGTWIFYFLKQKKLLDNRRFEILVAEQNTNIQLINGIQDIKLNNAEDYFRNEWVNIQYNLFKLNKKMLGVSQYQQAIASTLNEGKNIIITFFSALSVVQGHMSLGAMMAIQYMIGQLNGPIDQIIEFVQSWQYAKISLDRLSDIRNSEDEDSIDLKNANVLSPVSMTKLRGGFKTNTLLHDVMPALYTAPLAMTRKKYLTLYSNNSSLIFKNISFSYPGGNHMPVIKNISLKIPIGKTTAIVGNSGSGKTTLLKLILKLYQPESGEILLDDILLANISQQTWRDMWGVVMQETFIFSGSIESNIAVGIKDIDKVKLSLASRVARIDEFVGEMPLGFKTKIGQGEINMSAGQKQRLLIARAIYKDSDFILFDEATNNLDTENEKAILSDLEIYFKDRTIVVAAHRLSTVMNADQIVVMDKGSICECGTHAELIKLGGNYYRLIQNQMIVDI